MPAKKYSKDYKKKVIKLKMLKAIGIKELSVMTGVCIDTLRLWDADYRYLVMQEMAEESRKRRNNKHKRPVTWHQYGSGAGRYE